MKFVCYLFRHIWVFMSDFKRTSIFSHWLDSPIPLKIKRTSKLRSFFRRSAQLFNNISVSNAYVLLFAQSTCFLQLICRLACCIHTKQYHQTALSFQFIFFSVPCIASLQIFSILIHSWSTYPLTKWGCKGRRWLLSHAWRSRINYISLHNSRKNC